MASLVVDSQERKRSKGRHLSTLCLSVYSVACVRNNIHCVRNSFLKKCNNSCNRTPTGGGRHRGGGGGTGGGEKERERLSPLIAIQMALGLGVTLFSFSSLWSERERGREGERERERERERLSDVGPERLNDDVG